MEKTGYFIISAILFFIVFLLLFNINSKLSIIFNMTNGSVGLSELLGIGLGGGNISDIISSSISFPLASGGIAVTYNDGNARSSLSETIVGIDYDSSSGVFSLTSGYVIPTTVNETNWNTAFNHVTESGASHSYISQDVTAGGMPIFTKVIVSAVPVDSVDLTNKGYVDSLIQGLDWQESIIAFLDFTVNEPVGPALGDRYVNNNTGVGSGDAHENMPSYYSLVFITRVS